MNSLNKTFHCVVLFLFKISSKKVLGAGRIGKHSAIIGPIVTAKEDSTVTKVIRAKSEQLYSWKNPLPGCHFPEGRREILDLPMPILSKWRNMPLGVHRPFRG